MPQTNRKVEVVLDVAVRLELQALVRSGSEPAEMEGQP